MVAPRWIWTVVLSVGTVWGLSAGLAVEFHALGSVLSDPLNLVLNAYLMAFGAAMVVVECHEQCAAVEWYPSSQRRLRGQWVLALLFVASLCTNQWSFTGIVAGSATALRALSLGLRMTVREYESDSAGEEEELHSTSGFGSTAESEGFV